MWKIVGENLTQKFNRRVVFRDVSFQLESGQSLVISGPNGSGKTTLIRVICHLLQPTSGKIGFIREDIRLTHNDILKHIGLVGPYLQLYNNLSALENFTFFSRIRGFSVNHAEFRKMMERAGLKGRELDDLKTFSSGMLQRMKYLIAIMHTPHILIVDEPTANLDEEGVQLVSDILWEQKKDKILIIATNEPEELNFGDEKIALNP